jgi:membrane protein implicated in regulation of membrane protease activity
VVPLADLLLALLGMGGVVHCRYVELLWNGLLCLAPAFMALMLLASPVFIQHNMPAMVGVMVAGLIAYCLLFAINSSIHSYLIVRWVKLVSGEQEHPQHYEDLQQQCVGLQSQKLHNSSCTTNIAAHPRDGWLRL